MESRTIINSPIIRTIRGMLLMIFIVLIAVLVKARSDIECIWAFPVTFTMGLCVGLLIMFPQNTLKESFGSLVLQAIETIVFSFLSGVILERIMDTLGFGFSLAGPVAFTIGSLTGFAISIFIGVFSRQPKN